MMSFRNMLLCLLFLPVGFQKTVAIGIYLNSWNTRYGSMAGVNMGIGGSPLDLATNPANLGTNGKKVVEVNVAVPHIEARYQDRFINAREPANSYYNDITADKNYALPNFGIQIPIDKNFTYGMAFYLPGGGMGEVKNLVRLTPDNLPFRDSSAGFPVSGQIGDSKFIREDFTVQYYTAKLTNGVSYRNGALSLGLGLEVVYAKQINRLYEKDITGTIRLPGQGFDYRSDPAFAPGFIAGIAYELSKEWKVGYSYQAKNRLYLNGEMQVGVNDPKYFRTSNVSAYFELPERHSAGIAWSKESFTIGLDGVFVPFSQTQRSVTYRLSDPWFPTPIGSTNTFKANLHYHDAWTIALGGEYRRGRFAYRIGHNYGKTPVTPDGMSPPQAGAIHQHNTGLGIGMEVWESWKLDAGLSILYYNKVSGSATSDWTLQHAVFSPVNLTDSSSIQVTNYSHSTSASVIALLFGISRAW